MGIFRKKEKESKPASVDVKKETRKVDKKDDGTVKLGKAAFDYQGFLTTVERYGPITDADLNLREVMRTTGTKLAKMVEDAGVHKSKTPPPKEEETHIEQGEAELPPPRRKK